MQKAPLALFAYSGMVISNLNSMRTLFAIIFIGLVILVFSWIGKSPDTTERAGNRDQKTDLITISNVDDNETIVSPLTVTGEARGTWYFEASFPLKVTDNDGNVLGQGYATAQGEWMTEDFVPFTGTIEFDPGEVTEGWLMLEKDNPSGLPENDDAVRIPVQF